MSTNSLIKLLFFFLGLIVLGAVMNLVIATYKLGQLSGWW